MRKPMSSTTRNLVYAAAAVYVGGVAYIAYRRRRLDRFAVFWPFAWLTGQLVAEQLRPIPATGPLNVPGTPALPSTDPNVSITPKPAPVRPIDNLRPSGPIMPEKR